MNCRRVEKLIPLYIEGDLESHSRERIASHLEWCGRCNWLADEFRESQSWLRSTRPPEFDETFLSSFKADALKLIAETNAKPSFLASVIQQWSRRQVLALAGAMMIIVAIVVLYVYQGSTSGRLQVADTTSPPEIEVTLPTEPQPAPHKKPDTGLATGADLKVPQRAANRTAVNARREHSVVSPHTIEPPLPVQVSQSAASGPGSLEPPLEPSGNGDDSQPMLRIEMQTSDPNIRIIWFAPKEVESPTTNQ
ncbi:MAG TPA: zf-HC2 domain-containing protein [Blastocatellia bacterium]|nr:zf-HC2 domain-containing protein [Blastocatellia bacterium]